MPTCSMRLAGWPGLPGGVGSAFVSARLSPLLLLLTPLPVTAEELPQSSRETAELRNLPAGALVVQTGSPAFDLFVELPAPLELRRKLGARPQGAAGHRADIAHVGLPRDYLLPLPGHALLQVRLARDPVVFQLVIHDVALACDDLLLLPLHAMLQLGVQLRLDFVRPLQVLRQGLGDTGLLVELRPHAPLEHRLELRLDLARGRDVRHHRVHALGLLRQLLLDALLQLGFKLLLRLPSGRNLAGHVLPQLLFQELLLHALPQLGVHLGLLRSR
mmetsp:Transcript_27260/g.78442  ORF Transcript_27260/g.78442 Transcript_27260/m.78442 type:complete len:274 (+) Transcript_27260:128-949(+)